MCIREKADDRPYLESKGNIILSMFGRTGKVKVMVKFDEKVFADVHWLRKYLHGNILLVHCRLMNQFNGE